MLEELKGKILGAVAKALGFVGWSVYTAVPKPQRAPLAEISGAVAKLLGDREWLNFITGKAGKLNYRLTMFTTRVLDELRETIVTHVTAELQPVIVALEAARDDALKQVSALELELDRFKRRERERFPADVWDIVIAIWKELREEKRLFIPEWLDIGPKRRMATAYIEANGSEAAARKVGEEEMERFIAEGKTRPWGECQDPADEKKTPRVRAYEIFNEERRAAGVFTEAEVETADGMVATAEYAVGRILPVLDKDGEDAARAEAKGVLANLGMRNYTENRPHGTVAHKPKPEQTPVPKAAEATVTTTPAKREDDLADELKPPPPENGNGFGEMFLTKAAEKVVARGETPVTAVFKAEVAFRLIHASYDSLEKMVVEKSTPGVDGWMSLVRAAQEHLDAAAAKQQKKQAKHDEKSLARKIERVRAAFSDGLTDDDVRGLVAIRVAKPSDLDGKDLAHLAKEMAKALPAGQGKAHARQLLEQLAPPLNS